MAAASADWYRKTFQSSDAFKYWPHNHAVCLGSDHCFFFQLVVRSHNLLSISLQDAKG